MVLMLVAGLQVDTMIVQAIGLLDDLDKELNTYAMRVREWYGWHFPEMTKIVADNIKYAKAVSFLSFEPFPEVSSVVPYSINNAKAFYLMHFLVGHEGCRGTSI